MKIGILADIHEDVHRLNLALERLRQEGVEQLVLLGDVFDTGQHLAETVAVLAAAGVPGVYGNHELGLCYKPEASVCARYPRPVLDYLRTLQPRLELEDCLFSHGLPSWDPNDPAIYYLGPKPEEPGALDPCFAATSQRVLFVGHFHRWRLATPQGFVPWTDAAPVRLERPQRYFVVIAAVSDGWCALFDTDSGQLTPYRLAPV